LFAASWCFCYNDPAPSPIYTLSLHDALPICAVGRKVGDRSGRGAVAAPRLEALAIRAVIAIGMNVVVHNVAGDKARAVVFRNRVDRKSTRLNSSHVKISYAVFCLKKKKKDQ